MKYVIIGNSYAGLSCADAIRRFDKSGDVVIISDENYRAYARPLISYYLEGKTTDETIWYKEDDYYEKNNFKVMLGKKAVSVDTVSKKVVLEDGTELDYDKLFIGPGIFRPVFFAHMRFACLDAGRKSFGFAAVALGRIKHYFYLIFL